MSQPLKKKDSGFKPGLRLQKLRSSYEERYLSNSVSNEYIEVVFVKNVTSK